MGKARVCGARCHNSKKKTCRCWCGGVFHGAAGAENRLAFALTYELDKLPTTEKAFRRLAGQGQLFDDAPGGTWRWLEKVEAARKATEGGV